MMDRLRGFIGLGNVLHMSPLSQEVLISVHSVSIVMQMLVSVNSRAYKCIFLIHLILI